MSYNLKINSLLLHTRSSNPYPSMSTPVPLHKKKNVLGVKSVFLTEYERSFKLRQPKRLPALFWSVLKPNHAQPNSKPRL